MGRTLLKRNPFAFPGGAPGFDPSHPAAGVIRASYVCDGSLFSSLSDGGRTTIGAGTRVVGPIAGLGNAANFNAGWCAIQGGQPVTNDLDFTYAAIFQPITNTANSAQFCNDSTTGTAGVWFGQVGSGSMGFVPVGKTSVNTGLAAATADPYFWAVSCHWNGASYDWTSVVRRLNTGVLQKATGTGVANAIPVAPNGTYVIGNQGAGTNFKQARCQQATLMFSGQFHDLPTLVKWAEDPWAFWYPPKLDLWSMLVAAVSGTSNPLTVSATCTSTATYIKSVGKILPATCTSTATLIRRTAKTLLATCTSTSSMLKSVGKKLVATCTSSLIGGASYIAAGGTLFFKTVVATCTSTSSLVTHSSFARTVIATCTSTSTLIKRVGKTLLATCTSTSSVLKSIGKKLVATCTSTSSVVAHKCVVYFQTVIATCTSSLIGSTLKYLYAAVLATATLKVYKPLPPPVIPGSDTLYLLNELQKVSNAFNAHVAATKALDARLTAAGF
jgi:hypothetical protein